MRYRENWHVCPNCDGSGILTKDTDVMTCIICDGAGEIEADDETMFDLLRWGTILPVILLIPSLLLEMCR